jgi:hypothetical protein
MNLENWFVQYKVDESEGQLPGKGRRDPLTSVKLFTPLTRDAVAMCKVNAEHLQDVGEIYIEIRAKPDSQHQLSEWLSTRGESKLESFHDNLAHFGNTGMDAELADSLNLAGTARYNMKVRLKHALITGEVQPDPNLPVYWQKVVNHWDHSELEKINQLAHDAEATNLPFQNLELLNEDNGERFFSVYLKQEKERQQSTYNDPRSDHCQCDKCAADIDLDSAQLPPPTVAAPVVAARVAVTLAPPAAIRPKERSVAQSHAHQQQKNSNQLHLQLQAQQQMMIGFQFQQQQMMMMAQYHQPLYPMPQAHEPQKYCCMSYYHDRVVLRKQGRPTHDKGCPCATITRSSSST